jgi:hypothetical protein
MSILAGLTAKMVGAFLGRGIEAYADLRKQRLSHELETGKAWSSAYVKALEVESDVQKKKMEERVALMDNPAYAFLTMLIVAPPAAYIATVYIVSHHPQVRLGD